MRNVQRLYTWVADRWFDLLFPLYWDRFCRRVYPRVQAAMEHGMGVRRMWFGPEVDHAAIVAWLDFQVGALPQSGIVDMYRISIMPYSVEHHAIHPFPDVLVWDGGWTWLVPTPAHWHNEGRALVCTALPVSHRGLLVQICTPGPALVELRRLGMLSGGRPHGGA